MAAPIDSGGIDDHVPVEHRLAGIDRRTIAPALAVLALAGVMTLVLPAIDDAMEYDTHIGVGETIRLESVSFVPAVGWGEVTDDGAPGSARAIERVVVGDGTARFGVATYAYEGTAAEMLDDADTLDPALAEVRGPHLTARAASYTTDDGVTGVIERFTGATSEGYVATFVEGGVGVLVVVSAAENQLGDHTTEVNHMLDSIRFTPSAAPDPDTT